MESDVGIQKAIHESLKTRGSVAGPNLGRANIGRSNTLAREGIIPTTKGRSSIRRHSATDQQKIDQNMPKKLFGARRPSHVTDSGNASPTFLSRNDWIPLGDGWFQTTAVGTGSCSRFGLHSIIESSLGQLYVCIYEPRTEVAAEACNSECPQYDLVVSAKTILAKNSTKRQCFEILFAFKSATDYISLRCDVEVQEWSLHMHSGGEAVCLAAVPVTGNHPASDLKPNLFYSVLIQVRNGNTISADVDGVPIFTSVRLPEPGMNCSGLVGLLAKGSKYAVKGWKLRGADDGTGGGRLPASAGSVSATTSFMRPSTASSPAAASPGAVGSGRKRGSMSLRDSLGLSTAAASRGHHQRVGPPPVPYGGGGPPSSQGGLPGAGGTQSSLADEEEARLLRCSSVLRDHHDRGVVDMVLRDVVQRDMGVTFDDIAALATAKRLLNEAIVLPLMMPEFFTGIREPWKGVLLFGPPGTGKTMLAKAVADMNRTTFFSCSAASLISKYRGESEKIVKCLFEAARLCAPSIVFLDEVDALVSSRGVEGEHEASRRLKTEFFSQMDGVASSGQGSAGVMVLATTNCPWDLDEAMRRRLEKRIYIPLPDIAARAELFGICLRSVQYAADVNPRALARYTEGYSGADIHLVCREAAMMPMRALLARFSPVDISRMKAADQLDIPPVTWNDFEQAIRNTKPSVSSAFINRYNEWDMKYGSK